MILLHRLSHTAKPFHLNPDLIMTVESHPDTVITLSTGTKVNVLEAPEEVAAAVLQWRSEIAAAAITLKPAAPQPIS